MNKLSKFSLISCLIFVFLATSVLASDTTTSTPFSGFGLILTIIMIVQINKSEKLADTETKGRKTGVAGWLLFFIGQVAIMGFAGILRSISDIARTLYYYHQVLLSLSGLYYLTVLFDLVLSVSYIYVAYLLWKSRKESRKYIIILLIVDIILTSLFVYLEVYDSIASFSLITSIILLIYFLASTRVSNTYSSKEKIHIISSDAKSTPRGWIIAQAIGAIVILCMFQYSAWVDDSTESQKFIQENINYQQDELCVNYCNNFSETASYYFGPENYTRKECICYDNKKEAITRTLLPYDKFLVTRNLNVDEISLGLFTIELGKDSNLDKDFSKYLSTPLLELNRVYTNGDYLEHYTITGDIYFDNYSTTFEKEVTSWKSTLENSESRKFERKYFAQNYTAQNHFAITGEFQESNVGYSGLYSNYVTSLTLVFDRNSEKTAYILAICDIKHLERMRNMRNSLIESVKFE